MKAIKRIERMVPLIVEYKHLSNDDAVRKMLDEFVDLRECAHGVGSDEALDARHTAKMIKRNMRIRGPDHGFSLDERGYLKLREPH
jgi:hypothetical protein